MYTWTTLLAQWLSDWVSALCAAGAIPARNKNLYR